MSDERVVKFVGKGAMIPGVPPRDLTMGEYNAKRTLIEATEANTGQALYQVPAPPAPAEPTESPQSAPKADEGDSEGEGAKASPKPASKPKRGSRSKSAAKAAADESEA